MRSVLDQLVEGTGISVEAVVGQCSFVEEQQKIVRQLPGGEYECGAEIVVATPGRLMDHLQQTSGFSFENLRFLVIDEADRLLAQSYHDWVPRVLDAYHNKQTRPSHPLDMSSAPVRVIIVWFVYIYRHSLLISE